MIKPLALFVGLRYTRAKRRNHFVSFISLVSFVGIALGVAALITVLAVMNGFDREIRSQFFSLAPQITVFGEANAFNLVSLKRQIDALSGVLASAPYVSGAGVLNKQSLLNGVEVMGILPIQERTISQLGDKIVAGSLNSLTANSYHMVIGIKLAQQLGVWVSDQVILLTPQTVTNPLGVFPKFRRFTISGVFNTKDGFGFDSGIAYISLEDARKLLPRAQTGLHIKVADVYQAATLTDTIRNVVPPGVVVTNWIEQYGTFFKALAMEKTIMFSILCLIIMVAAFNLVSGLVMAVQDKRSAIAILRTLGAIPRTIFTIFMIQGLFLTLVGTALGVVGGIVLALNVTDLVNYIQTAFHVKFLPASVYFVDFLPSHLEGRDIVTVSVVSMGLGLLATLYPAFLAVRMPPVEALRYE